MPKPGKAVRGSKSGRPIMALLDLLGSALDIANSVGDASGGSHVFPRYSICL